MPVYLRLVALFESSVVRHRSNVRIDFGLADLANALRAGASRIGAAANHICGAARLTPPSKLGQGIWICIWKFTNPLFSRQPSPHIGIAAKDASDRSEDAASQHCISVNLPIWAVKDRTSRRIDRSAQGAVCVCLWHSILHRRYGDCWLQAGRGPT